MGKGCTSPSPVSLPDNDDLLLDIFLRLPPLPSSLVCKRWRRLLSDPAFLRRFRAHHRKPPMLGYFVMDFNKCLVPVFAPDRIPPARFSFPDEGLCFLGCRHGLALLLNRKKLEAVVWDPITGHRCCISLPPELQKDHLNLNIKVDMYNGAVLRDHHSSELVMVLHNASYHRAWACLYESKSGKWGIIVSTAVPASTYMARRPSILVGNALCWMLNRGGGGVLEFDTDKQSLAVIQMLEEIHDIRDSSFLRTEGGLGLAILSEEKIKLWKKTAISDPVARWVLQKTIELGKLISLGSPLQARFSTEIVGFDEDSNVMFLWIATGLFMIHLESMKSTNIPNARYFHTYFPFTSFYTSGLDIGGGDIAYKC